jgi:cleavage and polyadenylation specificity factor subunit 1
MCSALLQLCLYHLNILFQFCRRRVIQVYAKGARVLDGSFMTQELNFSMHTSESSSSSEPLAAASASIADPYVLLKMGDGSIRLLVGGMVHVYPVCL